MNANPMVAAILQSNKDDKARLIANVILELTFQARSKYAEAGPAAALLKYEVEAINKLSGYLILVLEKGQFETEHYLAETLTSVIQDCKSVGMKRLSENFLLDGDGRTDRNGSGAEK